jgi:hypothetical protein
MGRRLLSVLSIVLLLTMATAGIASATGQGMQRYSFGPLCEQGTFLGVEDAQACVWGEGQTLVRAALSGNIVLVDMNSYTTRITGPDGTELYFNENQLKSNSLSTEDGLRSGVFRHHQTAIEGEHGCEISRFSKFGKDFELIVHREQIDCY